MSDIEDGRCMRCDRPVSYDELDAGNFCLRTKPYCKSLFPVDWRTRAKESQGLVLQLAKKMLEANDVLVKAAQCIDLLRKNRDEFRALYEHYKKQAEGVKDDLRN